MRSHFETIWSEKNIEAWMLAPLSLLYASGWTVYAGLYHSGLKEAYQPAVLTICIGNLVAGGSGKSPFSYWLAERLIEQGHSVVMGMSGYGSPAQHHAQIAPEGQLSAKEWGDEPAMMRWKMESLPLIIGRDRVLAAKLAEEHFSDSILLMDDGFQHLRLAPRIKIVIEPDGPNDFCFPAGPYREPKSIGHPRASRIMRHIEDLKHVGPYFFDVNRHQISAPKEVDILCAIGQPWRLVYALEQNGIKIGTSVFKSDHDPLTDKNLFKDFKGERPLLVTSKDFVKLRERNDLESLNLIVADYELRPNNESEFLDWLDKKRDGKP